MMKHQSSTEEDVTKDLVMEEIQMVETVDLVILNSFFGDPQLPM